MSALLTHAAMGVLLGLALRWPARWLPLAALLAALPDLDHLDMYGFPLVQSRVTFHNVFFCLALPLAMWGALAWRKSEPTRLQLAAGAPLLLTSHLLLDLLPLDPVAGLGRMALFWPATPADYTFRAWAVDTMDPSAVTSSTTLLIGILAGIWFTRTMRSERPRGIRIIAAICFLTALASLVMTGTISQNPPHPNAILVLERSELTVPQDQLVVVIHHVAGDTAFGLSLELRAYQTLVGRFNVPAHELGPGQHVAFALPVVDARNISRPVLTLKAPDGHVYAAGTPTVQRGHIDAPLELLILPNSTIGVKSHYDRSLPSGAFALRYLMNNSTLETTIINASLAPGSTTYFGKSPHAANATAIALVGRDDGYIYDHMMLRPGS